MASKVEETSEEAKGHKEAEDSMPSPRKTFKVRMVAVRSPTPANSHCCCHCVLTQVVKDMGGNVRQQSISHFPLEIDQCVLDVSSYLKEHAAADGLADVRTAPLRCGRGILARLRPRFFPCPCSGWWRFISCACIDSWVGGRWCAATAEGSQPQAPQGGAGTAAGSQWRYSAVRLHYVVERCMLAPSHAPCRAVKAS